MRAIGFSSGVLDPVDPLHAIEWTLKAGLSAIELSSLRLAELDEVARSVRDPGLSRLAWVSIHAPSDIPADREEGIVTRLVEISRGRYPVVVHPDTMHDRSLWRVLGPLLLLENMDQRKRMGQFAEDFIALFEDLPEAGLCLDVAHLRQVDPTLTEGFKFLRLFGRRLRQIHMSELSTESEHRPISLHASSYLKRFLSAVPAHIPAIVESGVKMQNPLRDLDVMGWVLGEAWNWDQRPSRP